VTHGKRVLVAHETRALLDEIKDVLAEAGFSTVLAEDGNAARRMVDEAPLAAAVLDVALSPLPAFELIEHVRSTPQLAPMKIVLVASVYNRTAYKRKPVKLYGADDYVEQHHIKDMLSAKLQKLLGLSHAAVPLHHTDHSEPRVADNVAIPTAMANSADAERVRATAHSIVADIALYHSAELEAVIGGGSAEALADALNEGRKILEGLIPRSAWPSADPVRDAFVSFIAEMRQGGSHVS
jgi:DNA-binding response OmpR family regulator